MSNLKSISIVGAGIMGRMLAWRLIQRGHKVSLFDKDAIENGTAAAYSAAGMLTPYAEIESSEPLIFQMGMEGLSLWPEWIKSLNSDVGFYQSGSLIVSHHQDKPDLQRFNQQLNYKLNNQYFLNEIDKKRSTIPKELDQTELSKLEPELATRFSSATWLPQEAWLCPRHGLLSGVLAHLSELQQNKIQKLNDNYPEEIQPVTENFNSILSYEKKQRERYRHTMSDLAHSLKTPLAVIQSQMDKEIHSTDNIREQIQRINQIISHQLKRAVIRVNQNSIIAHTDKIPVHKVVKRLIKILDKVYNDTNITFHNLVEKDLYFFGDEADLLEVLGNLLDNACKYGKGTVTITGKRQNDNNKNLTSICISDNGLGIPESLQPTLLARGSRGDTAQVGQGIGLSVAVDIMSSYGGSLNVQNNAPSPHLTGACFCICFPN